MAEELRAEAAAESADRQGAEADLRAQLAEEAAAGTAADAALKAEVGGITEAVAGKMLRLQTAVREEFDGHTAQVLLEMEAQRTDLEDKMLEVSGTTTKSSKVRRCRLTGSKPVLKVPTVSALEATI